MEAFSDAVIAIILTIMVLEMKAPEGTDWASVKPLVPKFISYILSFLFIGIYWVNHHHLIHTVKKVRPSIMWANINLLFWLSLVPFATAWMGENHFERISVATYAVLTLFCGISYNILDYCIAKYYNEETSKRLARRKNKWKMIAATILYTAAIPIALFINPAVSGILFFIVSVIWLIPDNSVEHLFEN